MAAALGNTPFGASIREFFTLRRAEETIRGYAPAQHERVRSHFQAGERRLFAARRLALNPAYGVATVTLLREALVHYLLALHAADTAGYETETHVGASDLAAAMPEIPPNPADIGRILTGPTDDTRARDAVRSTDPLYFDSLAPEDLDCARWALDRAASTLRHRIEPRTLGRVRGVRWVRIAAAAIVTALALAAGIRKAVAPVDIALGKPVHPSSLRVNPPDGHELVDGDLGTTYGVHTNIEENANVVVDLVDTYRVTTVKVYNRMDGWFDDILPVVLEVSLDGTAYKEIARRDQHFGSDPPWIVDARSPAEPKGVPARYLRLRVPRRGYISLSELEAFGKKM
jgi:hypothetical protein